MNILFMPSWYESETEINAGVFFTEQAIALRNMGHNVVIAIVDILNYPYKSNYKKYKVIVESRHGMDVYRMVVPSLMTGHIPGVFFSYYAHYYKKLIRYMMSKGLTFDMMYAHSFWHAGYIASVIKKKYNIPLVIQEHRSMLLTGEFSDNVNKYLKASVQNSDAFYCVSSKLRDNVYLRTGLKEGVDLLPNMVDDRFCYQPLNNDRFTYTFIGTLNENKRVLQLINCFEKLRMKNSNVCLRIAGDGPLKEKVCERIKSSEALKESTEVLGLIPRESVLEELTKSNVLILPSAYETFGIVCIEALAVGRPVICTKNGATDFVTEDNGILIDVDSDEQLISAMESMYDKYSSYDLEKISERCRGNFSSTNVMNKLMSKFTEIVSH